MLSCKHPDHIISFDSSWKFYLIKRNKFDSVVAIKWLDSTTIDKINYSLDGVILQHCIDTLLFYNLISRKWGNRQLKIKDSKVIENKIDIKLNAINKSKSKSLHIENPNIGVIDCETFHDIDDIHKVYALGFITFLDSKPTMYYVNPKKINPNEIVLELVDQLLRPKYNDIKFYCHNLGGYDVYFILKVLCDYNT